MNAVFKLRLIFLSFDRYDNYNILFIWLKNLYRALLLLKRIINFVNILRRLYENFKEFLVENVHQMSQLSKDCLKHLMNLNR